MSDNKIICKLCNKTENSNVRFVIHLKTVHSDEFSIADYCIKFDIHSNYNCIYCNSIAKFISFSKGFKQVCTNKMCQNRYKYDRTKEALKNKYGVENASQIAGNSEKVKYTKLTRYGDENYNNPDKSKQTNLQRYGHISYTGTDEYNEKLKNTCQARYGVDHFTQSDEFKNQRKEDNIEKYGVDHPWKHPDILKKRHETILNLYGGYTLASPILREKFEKTMIDKYGTVYAQQSEDIRHKTKETNIDRYELPYTLNNPNINQQKYGVDFTWAIPGVLEKQCQNRKLNILEKYGVENVSQLKWVQDTIKENNIEKYGCEHPMQSQYIKNKQIQTMIERYGIEHSMHVPEIFERAFQSTHRKRYKHIKYITIFNDNITYQTKIELDFVKQCELNNVRIVNGDTIPYTFNGKNKKYYIDFKIFYDNKWQLTELKAPHKWYFESLKSGLLAAKNEAAIKYSENNNYHPFKFILYGDEKCLI